MLAKFNGHITIIAVAVLVCLTAGIVSAAPSTGSITYQGRLTDAAGNPLTGDYPVLFKLYDSESGGAAISADAHDVTATDGLFTTTISFDPSLYDGRGLWLGITVDTDPEMTPRQAFSPVPYAMSLTTTKKPIRYEYYTGPMYHPLGSVAYPNWWNVWDRFSVANMGNSPAEVCWYKYQRNTTAASVYSMGYSDCAVVNPLTYKWLNPTNVYPSTWEEIVKITSNSSSVVPSASLYNESNGQLIEHYKPGDFLKIEVYE